MRKQILVRGGIGNQMYQYAFLLFLRSKGQDVILNTSMYNVSQMHNGYELDRVFDIKEPIISYKGLKLNLLRLFLKYGIFVKKENFENIFDVVSNNKSFFDGYWQSYKYFESISNIIRKDFTFRIIDERCKSLSNVMKSQNSISLHIRRGDYLLSDGYSGICTDEYYKKAIDYIYQHIDNPFFYVFSDDKEWCSSNLQLLNKDYMLVDFNKGALSYQDMYLMSKCKHNIIANSSFSWWGAWLNDNPEKIVIAPKKWYNRDSSNYNQLRIPEQWTRL